MKAKLSREDALSILMRWNVGSTRISGSINSGSVVVKFIGYISEASRVGLKIRQLAEFGEELGEISVGLNTAREYESDTPRNPGLNGLSIGDSSRWVHNLLPFRVRAGSAAKISDVARH